MPTLSPVVRGFVKGFAINYLSSLRTSQQMEDRYRRLEVQVKRATTQELEEVAERFTDELLHHVDGIEELDALDESVLRECLLTALGDDQTQT